MQNSPSLSNVANSLTPTSSDAQGKSVIFTVQVGGLRARVTLTKSSKLSFTLDAGTTVMVSEPQDIIDVSPGMRYKFDSYDPSANVTMTEAKTITLVYKTQYYLTVTSLYGTTSGEGWYDKGATAEAGVSPLTVAGPLGVQYVFTGWSGNASGTTSPSNPITMDDPKTAIANWKTQYSVTFAQAGLDDSATGTVVTVDGSAKAYGDLPFSKWVDKDGSVSYAYEPVVSSSTSGKRFSQDSATGPSSTITVTGPITLTGNYKTQYQITFDQTGVEADFTGTILTIDNKGYTLPQSFWWDSGTTHTFAFQSPLVVTPNAKQYVCSFVRSTTGLSPDKSSSTSVSKSGSVTGNYKTQYSVTFAQAGLDDSATGTVVTVDGSAKAYGDLPFSKWVDKDGSVSYAYEPVVSSSTSGKRFSQDSATGPTSPITVNDSVKVIGNYKTQYELTTATNFGTTSLTA